MQVGDGGARLSRHSVHFDLNDDIYVGGLPAHMYRLAAKSLLRARRGFGGCLASLRLNGPSRDLLDGSFQLPPHGAAFITPGCDGKNPDLRPPLQLTTAVRRGCGGFGAVQARSIV